MEAPIDSHPSAERRIVTAVVVDIVGSTVIGERFDPEDARDILGPAIERIVETIDQCGGMVQDLAGDGVLALFGAIETRSDDVERALRAGLAIASDMRVYAKQVRQEWDLDGFGVRVGVETGPVVMGHIGGGSRVEFSGTGDSIRLAKYLEGKAQPFTVLVGPVTHGVAENICVWGDTQTVTVNGNAPAVTAYVLKEVCGPEWTQ